MDSRSDYTEALIWDPGRNQFDLVYTGTVAITCIGLTPSTQQKCGNKIDEQNIAIAKAVTHDLLNPESSAPQAAASQMRNLLPTLAKATLCQQEHQDQAAALSHKWYSNFEWCEPPGSSHESGGRQRDQGHDLRQDWKEVAARQPFRWEVNSEHPRPLPQFNHPSVMVESLRLQEQARLDDLETAERKREEQAREAGREQEERAREARHEAAMERILADQHAQVGEDPLPMQQLEAENETLRKARQLQHEEQHRRATQTRAEAREQLRATQEDRLGKEEKTRTADEARRLEAERKDG